MDLPVQEVVLERVGEKIPVRPARVDARGHLDAVAAGESAAVAVDHHPDVQPSLHPAPRPGDAGIAQQQHRALVADLGEGAQNAAERQVAVGRKAQVALAGESAFFPQEGAGQEQDQGQRHAGVGGPVFLEIKQEQEQREKRQRQRPENERGDVAALDQEQGGQREQEDRGENIAHVR